MEKWSGELVCETRWKENLKGRASPKNTVQELFCPKCLKVCERREQSGQCLRWDA